MSNGITYRTYIVRDGDTLATISQRIYGNINQWQKIADWNRIFPPYTIRVGQELLYQAVVPSRPLLIDSAGPIDAETIPEIVVTAARINWPLLVAIGVVLFVILSGTKRAG